jgi:hypothetical protein
MGPASHGHGKEGGWDAVGALAGFHETAGGRAGFKEVWADCAGAFGQI